MHNLVNCKDLDLLTQVPRDPPPLYLLPDTVGFISNSIDSKPENIKMQMHSHENEHMSVHDVVLQLTLWGNLWRTFNPLDPSLG